MSSSRTVHPHGGGCTIYGVAAAAALCTAYMLAGLGSYGLLDNNEGLYAAIASAMAQGGGWIVPQVAGLPYPDKPPLLYWLVALSLRAFGNGEWAVRLVPALAGLATVLVTGLATARAAGRDAGLRAAVVLGTSAGVVVIGRTLVFDMLFTLCLAVALLAWQAWWSGASRRWLRLGYAALALAVLAKGLVALVLAGLIVGAFALWERRRGEPLRLGVDAWGIALFAVIAVPWHAVAALEQPGFAWFYIVNEQLLRFLGLRQPDDYYAGAWWYYLPRFWAMAFPWIVVAPLLVARQCSVATGGERSSLPRDETFARFCVVWVLVVVGFYTLSRAKANYYVVQALPAAATLIALRLPLLWERANERRRGLAVLAGAATAIALAGAAWYLHRAEPGIGPVPDAWRPMQIACLVAAGLALIATAGFATRSEALIIGGFALMSAPLVAGATWAIVHDQPGLSARDAVRYVDLHYPGRPVGLFQRFSDHSALAYYLGKRLVLYDHRSADLAFARMQHARSPWLRQAADIEFRGGPPAIFVDVRDLSAADPVLGSRYTATRTFGTLVLYVQRPALQVARLRAQGPP
ncbi:MAG: glycosyltransferase family 39 protein [Betaproteobacteria bacterium]|nr:glycosyltransferase family 39 protein [Betaproteobacteria bacterium]